MRREGNSFKRVLVANRGEIAIRIFRACRELGIRTVAVYSEEDRTALFRTKADESYLIGKNMGPIEAYLNIDQIIDIALKKGVDAIHPGYGFLSENPEFAEKCKKAGIVFIGPGKDILAKMGDKIESKKTAEAVGVQTIPGLERSVSDLKDLGKFIARYHLPIILKAAAGGGGRGMRIVKNRKNLKDAFKQARNEAKKAFGIDDIFVEKYLIEPKHIEVQILGDNYGNLVHLYERDCSIQRRHQKLIEFTPAISLSDKKREELTSDALRLARAINYKNAGTVEFLVDKNGYHYFIEMNPRIQVEHTVSEMVTGIDIVQSQILIAEGYPLDSDKIGIGGQDSIQLNGYSIQSRITTEDPAQDFVPDSGRIDLYRTGSGFGIRLDGGNGYTGSCITPYFDSLLVKTISWSRSFEDAVQKAIRSIEELKISGVKTNAAFLINVLNHKIFRAGECDTGFIEKNPHLLDAAPRASREARILQFLGEKIINETKGIKDEFDVPIIPKFGSTKDLFGTKQLLDKKGVDGLVDWIKNEEKLLLTDTTFRDAHQSLMATRVRTRDMVKIAEPTAALAPELFSLEMWGGATFDVAYRFLKESPWDRLKKLRKKVPNILFQMLIRGSNAVGYKNYPDNVIREFIDEAAEQGIDLFRIFDSLNWLPGMQVALDQVRKAAKIAEVSICYTGDLLDKNNHKYDLDYYLELAREIEDRGAHILGIKDMAGLLKPYAAKILIEALKEEISIPLHLHTHDTSGNGVATLLMAAEAGVDIVDTAINSMAGLTSQPPLNSIVAALENTKRDPGVDLDNIQLISNYWSAVRPVYSQFESELRSGTAEIYKYEIPGGQYSNLKPQVESLGLGHRFKEVKEMYRKVNELFGNIIKVTPSSKVVGDMAIFMVRNDLTPENIYEKGKNLSFPDSVAAYFKGMIGQPPGGFPEKLQKLVLKGEEPIDIRPGELLEPEDFAQIEIHLKENFAIEPDREDNLSYALYPKVFEDYLSYREKYGDLSRMGSDIFFHGLYEGETSEIELEEGKALVVKLLEIGELNKKGRRRVVFEVNGFRREIEIADKAVLTSDNFEEHQMADEDDLDQIGAGIPGTVVDIMVEEDDEVDKGQPLLTIEAMKMETNITSPKAGKIKKIYVTYDQQVETGELIIRLL